MKPHLSTAAHARPGFTIIELLVSISLLAGLMLVLAAVTESASRAWREGSNRTDAFQSARSALELMSRELTAAVVDTRMQFVIGPSSVLSAVVKKNDATLSAKFAAQSPIMLWMAPLGDESSLRCVGYYLVRDPARKLYSLKRLFIAPPTTDLPSPYFPRMVSTLSARDTSLRTSPVDASWFTRSWNAAAFDDENAANQSAVVSPVADGVIALWIQPLDLLGNPIPQVAKAANHPKSPLYFNSAAYFEMATTTQFENGSFVYLAETPQSMKANRVPAAVELTIVTIDSTVLARGGTVPEQVNVADKAGTGIDVTASVAAYEDALRKNGIFTARVFSTRTRLANGT